MNLALLAPCNYYCGNCILYKKNKCLGCSKETEKAKAQGKTFCDIYLCAKDDKLITAQAAEVIHAKNTIKASSLKASLNG
jgi:hypothetical protein